VNGHVVYVTDVTSFQPLRVFDVGQIVGPKIPIIKFSRRQATVTEQFKASASRQIVELRVRLIQ